MGHLGFWLSTILMLAVLAWTLFDANRSEVNAEGWVSHSQDVLQELAEINELIAGSDAANGAFAASGANHLLLARNQALEALDASVARVKLLTADNPAQQLGIAGIEQLLASRQSNLQAVDRATLNGATGAQNAPLYRATAALRHEELRLLALRTVEEARHHRSGINALVAAVLIGVIIMVPGYLGFILQARANEKTEIKLRMMADRLPGAMYQLKLDPQGNSRFTFASAGVVKVCGIRADTAADWTALVNAIDPQDRPGFVAAMAEAIASLSAFRHEYRVKDESGADHWLHHEAALQRDVDGGMLQNGYIADITEQERLKTALQTAKDAADSANRAKSTFLATMSHEIRTPMNGVLGMLELLSLTKLDNEQRATLRIIRDSGKSLLRIIDDILDFSKIEAGKLEVIVEAASISSIIEDVHNIYSGNASSKGLHMRHRSDRRISPALLVDPVRLRQILNNLVSNAIKFTPRGGSIVIKSELVERSSDRESIAFSVKDNGKGITADIQRQLFQPFSQGNGDTNTRAGGTGLGLTICRRLAEMMGGSIDMVSEPGKGTTMTLILSLPIADPKDIPAVDADNKGETISAAAKLRRMAPSVEQAEAEGTLVLLVDDHPINRTLLLRQVHALGYAAESAVDGVEALAKWKSGRFGMVITDVNMPEMDGYELVRNIRKMEAAIGNDRVPIIACTANVLQGEAENCYAAGMDDYLVKPVELSHILKALDEWLPIPEPPGLADIDFGDGEKSEAVDRSVLAEISGGNPDSERDILIDFRRINDEDADMLKRAVATADMPGVARAAHRISGASRMVGALALAAVCQQIEQAGRANQPGVIAEKMAAFYQEWMRLNAYFDTH